jgi:hypothetical protein
MLTMIAVVLETLTAPLLIVAWLARALLLGGAALFLFATPLAHKGLGISLFYLAQAMAMTFLIRFLRKLRARAMYR